MVTAVKSIDMLIEGVLDNGLIFIGEYLEKILQHAIIIADHHGKILFPENDHILETDSMFVKVDELMDKREYCYFEETCCLYYGVEANHHNAYVIVKNLRVELVAQVLTILRECRLPVKCYFAKMNKSNELFARELTEYLFAASKADIKDILHLNDSNLDMNRSYYALLLQAQEARLKTSSGMIHSYVLAYLEREKRQAISAYQQDQWIFIIPANSIKSHHSHDLLDGSIDLSALKKILESKFKLSLSVGVGQGYDLIDLRKSVNEARIAVILNLLTKQSSMIQKFSDLGIYKPIFTQEMNHIYQYCSQTLGKLIEHDCKNDGELLPTLRKLLDTCGNNKVTADQLFIHVNTLYYRINKIEQILNIDLSKMYARVELYTAIKVWDTLQILNGKEEMTATLPPSFVMQA